MVFKALQIPTSSGECGLRWARQAKAENKLASSREGKDSEEAERARQELVRSGMKKGREIEICEEIFEIWAGFLEKPLRTSIRSSDGEPSGPLIRFTTSCLNLVGLTGLSGHAIRQRVRHYEDNVTPAQIANRQRVRRDVVNPDSDRL